MTKGRRLACWRFTAVDVATSCKRLIFQRLDLAARSGCLGQKDPLMLGEFAPIGQLKDHDDQDDSVEYMFCSAGLHWSTMASEYKRGSGLASIYPCLSGFVCCQTILISRPVEHVLRSLSKDRYQPSKSIFTLLAPILFRLSCSISKRPTCFASCSPYTSSSCAKSSLTGAPVRGVMAGGKETTAATAGVAGEDGQARGSRREKRVLTQDPWTRVP